MSDKRQRCVEIKCLMNWKSHIEVLLIVVLLNSVRDRVFFGRSIEESALLLERTVLSPSRDISPDHVAVKTRHMILGLSRTKRWSGMLFFLWWFMIVFLVFVQSNGLGSRFSGCHFVFSFIRHSVWLLNINIGELVIGMLDYESENHKLDWKPFRNERPGT